jgi:hypothetical protein
MDDEDITVSQLYPNPFTQQLHFETNGDFAYQLLNTAGLVLETGHASGMVDLAGSQPKGVYMLKITQANKVKVVKVVKE